MKQKLVLLIIFSWWGANVLTAQNIDETYRFANQQFAAGNYQQALTEYQRIAFFDQENIYKDVYSKIGDSFYAMGDLNRAQKNYDIAIRFSNNDSLRTELVFKKAQCMFQQQNYIFALNELFILNEPGEDYLRNKYNLYLGIAFFGTGDYSDALNCFNKIVPMPRVIELTNIFNEYEKYRKRINPSKIQILSILFPGLGQFYIGNIGSGINSVLLVGGIAVVTVYVWQIYGFLEAALSTGSWYYRYYTGGYKNAENLAYEKLEHKKNEVYNSVLNLIESEIKEDK